MTRITVSATPPFPALLGAACALLVALRPAPAQETAGDSAALEGVARAIIRADNAADLGRVMELYSDTALLFPPGAPPVRGRTAIRPRYASLFREFVPELESAIYEVRAGPGFGYVVGRTLGRFRGRDGAEERRVDDDYVLVAARESDGRWRIVRLIWNPRRP